MQPLLKINTKKQSHQFIGSINRDHKSNPILCIKNLLSIQQNIHCFITPSFFITLPLFSAMAETWLY
ncbi:MAG: hypothetical protein CVT94_08820 [Bacteroidetes bacterium HGW-Bacteroidetes-11]|nr:MAG: hypothetical protein CVT94_08820 [Bacteroidetes bacterium HGW-Bacteroidetes-11]